MGYPSYLPPPNYNSPDGYKYAYKIQELNRDKYEPEYKLHLKRIKESDDKIKKQEEFNESMLRILGYLLTFLFAYLILKQS